MTERRFIEETFPIKEISKESLNDKRQHYGHISSIHNWWARRPLPASRATIYASLITYKKKNNEIKKDKQFICELAKWENSNNLDIIKKARDEILKQYDGFPPKILDPFGGGGAIPLEAYRLGCDTYTSDYNPIAVLILKSILENPINYQSKMEEKISLQPDSENKLVKDFKFWSNWVLNETKKDLDKFYNIDEKEYVPIAYYWSKTIVCDNPSCKKTIPLFGRFVLSTSKKIRIFPKKNKSQIDFLIKNKNDKVSNKSGNIKSSKPTCLMCGTTGPKINSERLKNTPLGEKLIAVILKPKKGSGKIYRIANANDFKNFELAEKELQNKISKFKEKWGIHPIPDEPTPEKGGAGAERAFIFRNFNILNWGEIFNPRQKLAAVVLIDKIRLASEKMIESKNDLNHAKKITLLLSFLLDQVLGKSNNLARWNTSCEKIEYPFSNNSIPMIWDYPESYPLGNSAGGWKSFEKYIISVLEHLTSIPKGTANVKIGSSTNLSYSDEFFDAVFTDPPYYDNIPYSYLSDFYYVWLKRTLNTTYSDFFVTPLTPKSNEIVAYTYDKNFEDSKIFFEKNLSRSCSEIFRVLKKDGIFVIVYAHKSTAGWEALINSLNVAGFVITASWPIHTEMKGRQRGIKSGSLSSSIYLIARKQEKESIGFYREVKKALKIYLDKKLEQLWKEDISGADFFISAIGSAIEVFGKYKKVVDDGDNPISVITLLDDTREIVTNYAINKVIKGEFSDEISKMTRFYILWRWAYGESKVPYDEALKMGQSVGIDLPHELDKSFIVRDSNEFVRLAGPDERDKKISTSDELIDILHLVLLLWKNKKKESWEKLLKDKKLDRSNMFKRVGQAIFESSPPESKEWKWLNGFLAEFRNDDGSSIQSKLYD